MSLPDPVPAVLVQGFPFNPGEFSIIEGELSVWPPFGGLRELRVTSPFYCGPHITVEVVDDVATSPHFFRTRGEYPYVRLESNMWVPYTQEQVLSMSRPVGM